METINEIVTDMRKRFKPYAKSDSNDARYVAYLGYAEFADRIEKAIINCNQFKMREVLKEIQATLSVYHTSSLGNQEVKDYFEKIIEQALSAPPRNCDLYETENETLKAFHATYPISTYYLYVKWLFAEAKGDAK